MLVILQTHIMQAESYFVKCYNERTKYDANQMPVESFPISTLSRRNMQILPNECKFLMLMIVRRRS